MAFKPTDKDLTGFEAHVIERKGTEPPFTGMYTFTEAPGTYLCKRCSSELYRSEDKFASHCGWPSFDDEIPGAVERRPDADGRRVEIVCKACSAHLGHVFAGEGQTAKNVRHCVNSVSLDFRPAAQLATETAVLASGCFWGTQYFLSRIPGVSKTTVGYSGGTVDNPTYEQVCGKKTGHLEAVEVIFDPKVASYDVILRVFFETHDFSQKNGQGPDIGPQYLSAIFAKTPAQETSARKLIDELKAMGHEVATQIRPSATFWPAEGYHQLYYERKGDQPYCHVYRQIFKPAPTGIHEIGASET